MGNFFHTPQQILINPVNLKCYTCKVEHTVETTNSPHCPDCHNILAFACVCEKCTKSFWASQRFSKCRMCALYHTCIYCDNETKSMKCDDCQLKNINCRCCNEIISKRPKILFDKNYCDNCFNFIIYIQSKDKMHPDKEIVIFYNEIEEVHDGYCSEPYNDDIIHKQISTTFPLIKSIDIYDSNNIDENKNFNITNEKLYVYNIPSTPCQRGSGYCNTKTTYEIIEARLL